MGVLERERKQPRSIDMRSSGGRGRSQMSIRAGVQRVPGVPGTAKTGGPGPTCERPTLTSPNDRCRCRCTSSPSQRPNSSPSAPRTPSVHCLPKVGKEFDAAIVRSRVPDECHRCASSARLFRGFRVAILRRGTPLFDIARR